MRTLISVLVLTVVTGVVCAQTGIRSVDFKNFTYTPSCTGEKPEKLTVKDGELSREKQEKDYVDRFYFKIFQVVYGDVPNPTKL